MAEKTYPVLDTLIHDDKTYGPLSKLKTIRLEEEVAATLPAGVLGEPVKAEKADKV